MTAQKIMEITKPGDLFSNDSNRCQEEYKCLARKWHPDMNEADTSEVFGKITQLYHLAQEQIALGIWERTGYVSFTTDTQKQLKLCFLAEYPFELGISYICNRHILYVFDKGREKYYQNAVQRIMRLSYENGDIEREFARSLPRIFGRGKLSDGRMYLTLEKEEGEYPLAGVLQAYGGRLPDRHAAWIVSRLENLACYFAYSHLVHNAVSVENCFISPKEHGIQLYGGWWYAVGEGEKMMGTTGKIYSCMPIKAKNEKKADAGTDLEAIKLLGRELLGGDNCRLLKERRDIPRAFTEFLISGSLGNAFEELEKWDKTLKLAYGERRFVEMKVTQEDIYKR